MFYIIKTDLTGNYTYCNKKFLHTFSWAFSKENIVGESDLTVTHPDDVERVHAVSKKCIENPGQSHHVQIRKPISPENYVISEWEFLCLTDSNDKPSEILCSGIDITTTKKLESSAQLLDTLTKIISESTELFDEGDNLYTILEKNFAKIGNILPLDRIFYFERKSNEKFIFSQKVEWGSPHINIQTNNPSLQEINISQAEDLLKSIETKVPYNQSVKDIRDPEMRKYLLSQGIYSILVCGIVVEDSLEGLIGFDCRRTERTWDSTEITFLEILSTQIVIFLKKRKVQNTLQTLEQNLKNRAKELFEYKFALDSCAIVAITNLRGVITYVNDQFVKISKYAAEELIGKTHKLINSGYHSQEFFQNLWNTIRAGKIWRGEICNRAKDGVLYWVDSTIIPFLDEKQQPYQYIVIRYEVTDRKLAEKKIQENEKKLRLITENASALIMELDTEGNILFSNKSISTLSSSNQADIKYEDLISDEQKIIFKKYLNESISSKEPREFEIFEFKELDMFNWFLVRLSPIVENQKVQRLILVANDITERKQFEVSLEKAAKEAEKATRIKSEFIANMSHEIRTPLNGVIGFTELLKATNLNAIQLEYVRNASVSAHTLFQIINDILDFSKIEAQKLDLEIIKTDIWELVEQIIDILKYESERKNLEFLVDLDASTPRYVMVDPIRLKQVLTNLLSNALKFTEQGEVELKVHFERTKENSGSLYFWVRDTGIGIRPDQKEKLFQAFSQADSSTTRKYGGTGLGLVISNLLVEKMKGKIQLETEFGKGSTFYFSIPVQFEEEHSENIKNTSIKHILVVDDNHTNLIILEKFLQEWDIQVTTCESGILALDILKNNMFDFIIMDYHMPTMDGLETVKRIRENSEISIAKQPIILLYSSAEIPLTKAEMQNLQIQHYLVKPVKFSELKNLLFSNIKANQNVNSETDQPATIKEDPALSLEVLQILVADDVDMNLMLVCTVLEGLLPNANIIQVKDGLAAWNYAKSFNFDLILLDVLMPEMDGITVCQKIREWENLKNLHTPIIALTAGTVAGEKEKCLQAGMDDFLTKPLELSKFKEVLQKWIKNQDNEIIQTQLPEQNILNLATMEEFIGKDDSLKRKFLEKFISVNEDKFQQFIDNFKNLPIPEIKDFAHKTIPSLKTIGALNLFLILQRIEKHAINGTVYPENKNILELEFQKLTARIRTFLKN